MGLPGIGPRYRDRADAGAALAEALAGDGAGDLAGSVVIALPRGGLPVAAPVAARLGAPLDIVFVRKLGAPGQPELALGAVVDGAEPIAVYNDGLMRELGLTADDLAEVREREIAEIARRRAAYGGGAGADVAGRPVILVDDGIATGATMLAAVRAMKRRRPAAVVVAVPVASRSALARLEPEADRIVCRSTPRLFRAVGEVYRDFPQVSDDEVRTILAGGG